MDISVCSNPDPYSDEELAEFVDEVNEIWELREKDKNDPELMKRVAELAQMETRSTMEKRRTEFERYLLLLEHPDPVMRTSGAADLMMSLLTVKDESVRKRAVRPLVDALADVHPWVRLYACQGLGILASGGNARPLNQEEELIQLAVERLTLLLEDSMAEIREFATDALNAIQK